MYALVAESTIDLQTRLAFSIYESPGVYALLLGSGVSRAAQIPTGWENTPDLIRRLAALEGVSSHSDWAAWYREVKGREPDYSEIVRDVGGSPEERRALLHSYIEPTEEERQRGLKTPTTAHDAVARLVRNGYVRLIVTTNFDRPIENALREHAAPSGNSRTTTLTVSGRMTSKPLVTRVGPTEMGSAVIGGCSPR